MRKNEEITKHTLNLYSGDYLKLRELYPEIGAGAMIRRIVRKFIESVESGVAPTDLTQEVNL